MKALSKKKIVGKDKLNYIRDMKTAKLLQLLLLFPLCVSAEENAHGDLALHGLTVKLRADF